MMIPAVFNTCAVQVGQGDQAERREAFGLTGNQNALQKIVQRTMIAAARRGWRWTAFCFSRSASCSARRFNSDVLPTNPMPAGSPLVDATFDSTSRSKLRK